jgi:hypothetical protein
MAIASFSYIDWAVALGPKHLLKMPVVSHVA